jgi:hypothetical protein
MVYVSYKRTIDTIIHVGIRLLGSLCVCVKLECSKHFQIYASNISPELSFSIYFKVIPIYYRALTKEGKVQRRK